MNGANRWKCFQVVNNNHLQTMQHSYCFVEEVSSHVGPQTYRYDLTPESDNNKDFGVETTTHYSSDFDENNKVVAEELKYRRLSTPRTVSDTDISEDHVEDYTYLEAIIEQLYKRPEIIKARVCAERPECTERSAEEQTSENTQMSPSSPMEENRGTHFEQTENPESQSSEQPPDIFQYFQVTSSADAKHRQAWMEFIEKRKVDLSFNDTSLKKERKVKRHRIGPRRTQDPAKKKYGTQSQDSIVNKIKEKRSRFFGVLRDIESDKLGNDPRTLLNEDGRVASDAMHRLMLKNHQSSPKTPSKTPSEETRETNLSYRQSLKDQWSGFGPKTPPEQPHSDTETDLRDLENHWSGPRTPPDQPHSDKETDLRDLENHWSGPRTPPDQPHSDKETDLRDLENHWSDPMSPPPKPPDQESYLKDLENHWSGPKTPPEQPPSDEPCSDRDTDVTSPENHWSGPKTPPEQPPSDKLSSDRNTDVTSPENHWSGPKTPPEQPPSDKLSSDRNTDVTSPENHWSGPKTPPEQPPSDQPSCDQETHLRSLKNHCFGSGPKTPPPEPCETDQRRRLSLEDYRSKPRPKIPSEDPCDSNPWHRLSPKDHWGRSEKSPEEQSAVNARWRLSAKEYRSESGPKTPSKVASESDTRRRLSLKEPGSALGANTTSQNVSRVDPRLRLKGSGGRSDPQTRPLKPSGQEPERRGGAVKPSGVIIDKYDSTLLLSDYLKTHKASVPRIEMVVGHRTPPAEWPTNNNFSSRIPCRTWLKFVNELTANAKSKTYPPVPPCKCLCCKAKVVGNLGQLKEYLLRDTKPSKSPELMFFSTKWALYESKEKEGIKRKLHPRDVKTKRLKTSPVPKRRPSENSACRVEPEVTDDENSNMSICTPTPMIESPPSPSESLESPPTDPAVVSGQAAAWHLNTGQSFLESTYNPQTEYRSNEWHPTPTPPVHLPPTMPTPVQDTYIPLPCRNTTEALLNLTPLMSDPRLQSSCSANEPPNFPFPPSDLSANTLMTYRNLQELGALDRTLDVYQTLPSQHASWAESPSPCSGVTPQPRRYSEDSFQESVNTNSDIYVFNNEEIDVPNDQRYVNQHSDLNEVPYIKQETEEPTEKEEVSSPGEPHVPPLVIKQEIVHDEGMKNTFDYGSSFSFGTSQTTVGSSLFFGDFDDQPADVVSTIPERLMFDKQCSAKILQASKDEAILLPNDDSRVHVTFHKRDFIPKSQVKLTPEESLQSYLKDVSRLFFHGARIRSQTPSGLLYETCLVFESSMYPSLAVRSGMNVTHSFAIDNLVLVPRLAIVKAILLPYHAVVSILEPSRSSRSQLARIVTSELYKCKDDKVHVKGWMDEHVDLEQNIYVQLKYDNKKENTAVVMKAWIQPAEPIIIYSSLKKPKSKLHGVFSCKKEYCLGTVRSVLSDSARFETVIQDESYSVSFNEIYINGELAQGSLTQWIDVGAKVKFKHCRAVMPHKEYWSPCVWIGRAPDLSHHAQRLESRLTAVCLDLTQTYRGFVDRYLLPLYALVRINVGNGHVLALLSREETCPNVHDGVWMDRLVRIGDWLSCRLTKSLHFRFSVINCVLDKQKY